MYRLETTLLHDGVLLGTYFFNGEPISWFSRLQKLVALSTAESEIYAAIDTAKVVAHLKVYFMTCIVMGSQLGNYKNARHFVTRLSYLQQVVQNGTIKFKELGTRDMIADIMTKALPDQQYHKLSSALVHDSTILYPA